MFENEQSLDPIRNSHPRAGGSTFSLGLSA
jgi:hypothetical protein